MVMVLLSRNSGELEQVKQIRILSQEADRIMVCTRTIMAFGEIKPAE
jgi:hypothetical protein